MCFTATFPQETNHGTQYYHEGQRGEEEADDQFDVRLVTHHHAQALTEGEQMGFLWPVLYNPEKRKLKTFAGRNLMHDDE